MRSRRGGTSDRGIFVDKKFLKCFHRLVESAKTGLMGHARFVFVQTGFQFVSSSLPDICYRCGESGHPAKDRDPQEDGARGVRRRGPPGAAGPGGTREVPQVCLTFSLLPKPVITAAEASHAKDSAKPKRERSSAATTKCSPAMPDRNHADEQKRATLLEFGHIQKDCTKVKGSR